MMSINKDCSNKQESELAKLLGGRVVAGSGCGQFNNGDIEVNEFLIECKTVTKPQTSFSIKKDWMDKIEEQRFECGKLYGALAFRFDPEGDDYVVIKDTDFQILLQVLRECSN